MIVDPAVERAEQRRLLAGGDPSTPHFCYVCQHKFKRLTEEGICSGFKPICNLSTDIQIEELVDKDTSPMERLYMEVALDPITWAGIEFGFSIAEREYQEPLLRCTARRTIDRCGRRIGKTTTKVCKALHRVDTRSDYTVLIVTPFQSQIELIFEIINDFVSRSITLKTKVVNRRKSPYYLVSFDNNSKIIGVTAGVKTGSGADKIRGLDAHTVWLDEGDQFNERDLNAIMPIVTGHKEGEIWVTGTPTGKREFYYRAVTDPNMGYGSFHIRADQSPAWTTEAEEMHRSNYSESAYMAEFDAEFPQLAEGVFPARLVEDSVVPNHTIKIKKTSWLYGMGVDWNAVVNGCHIVLVAWDEEGKRFPFVRKWIISREQYTQIAAVDKIIQLNRDWDPSFIYVDAGFGEMQIEVLHQYGRKNKKSQLHKKVKGINMGSNVKVPTTTMGKVDKPVKPFMVNLAVRRIEQGLVQFPKAEYHGSGTQGLVDQILAYSIKSIARDGRPIYTQGEDHTLTAWMLAMYGFWVEHTDLLKNKLACKPQVEVVQEGHRGNIEDMPWLSTYTINTTGGKEEEPTPTSERLLPSDRTIKKAPAIKIVQNRDIKTIAPRTSLPGSRSNIGGHGAYKRNSF